VASVDSKAKDQDSIQPKILQFQLDGSSSGSITWVDRLNLVTFIGVPRELVILASEPDLRL